MKILPVLVTFAVLIIFPAFIFYLLIRAVRDPKTRWWGIVILLAILTCYCTTMVGVAGLIVGGNSTGSVALEQRYCEDFRKALTQTETLPEAIARMDALSAGDDYRIHEPDKNLRFRYVWMLGGCFLFAGANLMMFGPGRREKRHPADCIMMILAALVVFLTGIWQIAWGNGYAFQASAYHGLLIGWHSNIRLDEIHETNAEIAAILGAGVISRDSASPSDIKSLLMLEWALRELSGEKLKASFRFPEPEERNDAPVEADSRTGPGVAVIGGADGPTAVFIGSELLKRQEGGAPADEPAANATESGTPD